MSRIKPRLFKHVGGEERKMDKNKSLEDYLVKPGEQSPFANLLVDLAFKKAFDPDKPTSRENLVNLLNDLLAPQLKRPIKNVWTRNVSNQAELGIGWKFDIKPTYVIAITRHRMFEDERIVHRATVTDLETKEKFMDSFNFTVVELAKVPFFIESKSDSLSKWLFFFRYLSRLRELPAELGEHKFKQLTESSKVSKFSKEEFEAYQKMFHAEWDHNALKNSFFEEFADDINAKVEERAREIAKRMIADGKLSNEEIAAYSGLSIEDVVVLRSQAGN